ncbi:GntR family transcriptional regulator [Microlunatus elymi]|uniref:GntR family transcriptional regulator n=1 Tax=Microlunatus elymi TaxID=2596828 RepID=A0A516PYZ7_9ACTN|nr:GntR family transcriptional regulator [Microlunatus elymi]QDP96377.1 GntR family transcriptional regulator [Microlunatus elymi]
MAGRSSASASQRVYTHVKELILSGELDGGELITEGEIADRLKVSRTPVREGFLRLQAEGWMRLYPKRGALITPVRPQEAEEVMQARVLLETHAVRAIAADKAARERLADELAAITERQQRATAGDDLGAFAIADADFHTAIVRAGDNDLLINFYAGLRDRQRRMTRDSVQGRVEVQLMILEQHRRLAGLVAAGDADSFETEITGHLHDTHRR